MQGAAYIDGVDPQSTPPPYFTSSFVNRPGDVRGFIHKRVLRAAKGFVTSGFSPTAALSGFLTNGGRAMSRRAPRPKDFRRFESSARTTAPSAAPRPVSRLALAAATGAPTAAPRPVSRLAALPVSDFAPRQPGRISRCGIGFVMRGGRCVREGGLLPSIERGFGIDIRGSARRLQTRVRTPPMARGRGGFQAVEGAFGMPAMVPEEEMRRTLVCPRGMVLGGDELCYPKSVLPRRSKFRKWRGQAGPPVSAGDARAIRKAAAAKERVLTLAKSVGLHASKTKPQTVRGRSTKHQHLLAAPAHEIRVISEETN